MPIPALILLLMLQTATSEPITVVGNAWAPFISPMGEPFRPRVAGDDPLARWFSQADGNADSILSQAEMEADGIRFFATLDLDSDGQILPDELVSYEFQTAPEIQVNSRWRDPRGEGRSTRRGKARSGYDPYGLQGAARYALLNIPQPVAAADADLDRSVTADEFRNAAAQRFRLLDKDGNGSLSLAELRDQLPPTRKDHRPAKKNEADKRIGSPVKVTD